MPRKYPFTKVPPPKLIVNEETDQTKHKLLCSITHHPQSSRNDKRMTCWTNCNRFATYLALAAAHHKKRLLITPKSVSVHLPFKWNYPFKVPTDRTSKTTVNRLKCQTAYVVRYKPKPTLIPKTSFPVTWKMETKA